MSIDEYTNSFIDKLEFTLRVVMYELEKIDRYSKGLQLEYVVSVKQAHNFEAYIWTASSVEDMIKKRTTDNNGVDRRGRMKESQNSNKKRKLSKFDPHNRKSRDKSETKWCEKLQAKSCWTMPGMSDPLQMWQNWTPC